MGYFVFGIFISSINSGLFFVVSTWFNLSVLVHFPVMFSAF